jgi:L-Ala-D/L-Glu epimerase
VKMRAYTYDLPLRHVFTISRGSMTVQPTVIVELEHEGVKGYGEATTNDYYGVTLEHLTEVLNRVCPVIEQLGFMPAEDLWEQLTTHLGADPFALCAVDQAAHDLYGKLQGQPLYQLWGLDPNQAPPTDYTIGIDEPSVMLDKMREFPEWPIYKIKLGTSRDLEIVQQLRAGSGAVFRVDANCGWTAAETIDRAPRLKELGVEFIEQPLPAESWEEMRKVYLESSLPVIADESCIVESDVPRCHGYFHGVNIKLVKCGGLTPARRMIERARQLGLRVMVGCMTESTVGISAIAHLAPMLDYVDMDGALLLAEDIATGVSIEKGICRFADEPGTGVRLTRPGRQIAGSDR